MITTPWNVFPTTYIITMAQRPPYRGTQPRPDPRQATMDQLMAARARQHPCNPTTFVNRMDIHEWGRAEITTQGDDDKPGGEYFQAAAISAQAEGTTLSVGFEPYEFFFDSTQRDATSDLANGLIGFTIGGLNAGQSIKNVVMIRLTPFFFPRLTLPATQPDFFFYNRIYLTLVSPFPANQAFLAANNKRYHFELNVSNLNGLAVLLTPTQERVVFRIPILALTGVQFMFTLGPYFSPISLPQDIMNVQAIPATNPMQFTIIDPGVTTSAMGSIGVQPAPGVAVFVTGFSSSTVIDATVNSSGGFFVTNILSATTFVTNIAAAVAAPVRGSMIVGKNRIAMQMEAVCASDHSTNYVNLMQV